MRHVAIRGLGSFASWFALLGTFYSRADLNAQSAYCRPLGSNPNQSEVQYLRKLAGATDSQAVKERSRIGMPQSDSTKVKNVVVETVCTKMVKTMDSVEARVDLARKVHLYKFANGWYAAVDPGSTTVTGLLVVFFYNNSSKYKGAFSLGGG